MQVYPELASWDEFYPSEIFIAMGATDEADAFFPILKKANIGATIIIGRRTRERRVQRTKRWGTLKLLPTSLQAWFF